MNGTIVKISNAGFAYNGEPAIDDVNLEIKRGDFWGVVGPNGSGKTTLLKIILGLLKPQKGSVELFGQPVENFRDWGRIGYVPQKAGSNFSGFPLSVEETVEMSGAKGDSVAKALTAVELLNKKTRLLRNLSGGQQQRVFIARALSTNPELLILDEPTVGVDADSQAKFYRLLKKLNTELALSLVLVSHDIGVVAHEAKQVACLNRTLICSGHPQEILTGDFLQKLYGKDLRLVIHEH